MLTMETYEEKKTVINNGVEVILSKGIPLIPYFLLSLPIIFGNIIAVSSYDKHIDADILDVSYTELKKTLLKASANSLLPFGALIGTFAATTISPKIGERFTTLLFNLFGIIGAVLYIIAYFIKSNLKLEKYMIFITAKFVFGINSGGIMTTGIIYIFQLVHPSHHYIISVSVQLAINLGLSISAIFSLESIIEKKWYITVIPMIVLQIICHILLILLPNSPISEFHKNKDFEALKRNLLKIRRTGKEEIETEAANIREKITESEKEDKISLLQLLRIRPLIRPLFFTSLLHIAQQFSGINAINYYTSDILDNAHIRQIDIGNVVLFLMCVGGSFIFAFIIPRFGSKTMLIFGHFMMSIFSFIAFGLAMSQVSLHWLTLFVISMILVMFQSGPGPKPWVMFSETFKPKYQAAAQGLLGSCNWSTNCIIAFTFAFMAKHLNNYSLLIFGCLNLLFSVIFLLFMVETKNKTPDEVIAEYEDRQIQCRWG